MRICIGSDHAGFAMKEEVKHWLLEWGFEATDFGVFSDDAADYPDTAGIVAKAVAGGSYSRGILVCGTGLGMSIAANKVRGIRAALAHDVYTALASRTHNDANVLALGARVIGSGIAKEIVKAWLYGSYEGGRHVARLKKIADIENEQLQQRD